MINPQETVYYKRARFSTRLPTDRRYDRSHYWLAEDEPGVFRVGFTKFATRMLGDLVELRFDVQPDETVAVGQAIGAIEGFKAVSDIYCAMSGDFIGSNSALQQDPALMERDPYDRGWLYRVRGRPADSTLDVHGYIQLLDATIDRMLAEQETQSRAKPC